MTRQLHTPDVFPAVSSHYLSASRQELAMGPPGGRWRVAHEAPAAWSRPMGWATENSGRILKINSWTVWNGAPELKHGESPSFYWLRSRMSWPDSYILLMCFLQCPAIICQPATSHKRPEMIPLSFKTLPSEQAQPNVYMPLWGKKIIWSTPTVIWTLIYSKDTLCSHADSYSHFRNDTRLPHH